MNLDAQQDLFPEPKGISNDDMQQAIGLMIGEIRSLQSKQWLHEMLLLQTFLRFADATGHRVDFVELVLANMGADIQTSLTRVPKEDVANREIVEQMSETFPDLAGRVRALAGSEATHHRPSGTRQ